MVGALVAAPLYHFLFYVDDEVTEEVDISQIKMQKVWKDAPLMISAIEKSLQKITPSILRNCWCTI